MRVTLRNQPPKVYWEKRWAAIPVDTDAASASSYPLKYAEKAVSKWTRRILDAGCGTGRVLRYYHKQGHTIVGMDYIYASALKKLKSAPGGDALRLSAGDIRHPCFKEGSFHCVLAFGLFHGLESGLLDALQATRRLIEPGGRLCASFRADNLHTRLIDGYHDFCTGRAARGRPKCFHKMNLKRDEFSALLKRAGFEVEALYPVINMSILYKFECFRAASQKRFDETRGRGEGFLLSSFAERLQSLLFRCFPEQICNLFVAIARRPPQP